MKAAALERQGRRGGGQSGVCSVQAGRNGVYNYRLQNMETITSLVFHHRTRFGIVCLRCQKRAAPQLS